MRQIVLFVILSLGFYSNANSLYLELSLNYQVDSTKTNPNLETGKSQIVIHVNNEDFKAGEKILYGYDQVGFEANLNAEKSFEFTLNSGKHIFEFYPDEKIGYEEITTYGGLHIASGTTTYISLTFQVAEVEMLIKKPVIYLYPPKKTDVTVSVQPKGKMSFTYPEYNEKWECTAHPSGELLIEDEAYNYLFWESEQEVTVNELADVPARVVLKDDLMEFLESSLDKFGFNSKEKMDFITFWAPQMLNFEATEIRFMYNDACTLFADLDIQPTPDNLLRFYMVWCPIDPFYYNDKLTIEIPQQTRNGFTVLEWGGMQIPQGNRLESLVESTSTND